jgi:hypothetical protein
MASTKSEFFSEAKSMLHISPEKACIENSIGENPQAFAAVHLNTMLFQFQTTTIPSTWHLEMEVVCQLLQVTQTHHNLSVLIQQLQ